MFNVNGWELAVIAILFILLFGPERIPEVVMEATRLIRQVRSLADGATADLRREIEFAAEDVKAAKETIGGAGAEVKRTIESAAQLPSIAPPRQRDADVDAAPAADESLESTQHEAADEDRSE